MTQSIPQLPAAQTLQCVIAWLEGGCDPKLAAQELRLLAAKPLVGAIPEPNPAMQQAGVKELREPYHGGMDYARVCAIWRAMHAAQPPAVQQDRREDQLNWRELAVWWEQGAKDWQDLKPIIRRMFERAIQSGDAAAQGAAAAGPWIDPEIEPPPRDTVVLIECKPGCFADYMPQVQTASSEWLHFGGKGQYTRWARINLPGIGPSTQGVDHG